MRRCDTFVGLDGHYLRAAVRPEWPVLVEAIADSGGAAMTVRLATVIEVLDEAYPPGLAQSWDSVGLVCGDPDDALSSVTIAVDATAAVVDEVPDGGLLLAHHPLLLRGVDTVAASTAKGALIHRLIRSGRSLFTAHTNADSASPGCRTRWRTRWADRRGGAGAAPATGTGQVGDLRAAENADACGRLSLPAGPARSATTRIAAGASPAPASSCRRRCEPGDRQRRRSGTGGRGPGRGRRARPGTTTGADGDARAHPTRSRRSTSLLGAAAQRRRAGADRHAAQPESLSAFVSRVKAGLPTDVVGGARRGRSGHGGVARRGVRRRGRLAAGHRGRCRCRRPM